MLMVLSQRLKAVTFDTVISCIQKMFATTTDWSNTMAQSQFIKYFTHIGLT